MKCMIKFELKDLIKNLLIYKIYVKKFLDDKIETI